MIKIGYSLFLFRKKQENHTMKRIKTIALIGMAVLMTACDKTPQYRVNLNADNEVACQHLTPYGLPKTNNENNAYYCLEGFAIEYNPFIASSMWVAERISYNHLRDNFNEPVRKDEYRPLPFLKEKSQPSLDKLQSVPDYKGYKMADTRNYRAKADDLTYQKIMSQTYYLTNVALLHKGASETMDNVERHIRMWSLTKKTDLVVFTGPLFFKTAQDPIIIPIKGNVKYRVPTHFYKIVISPKTKESIAMVIPNRALPDTRFEQYVVPMNFIYKYNYVDFLSKAGDLKEQYFTNKNNGSWKMYPHEVLKAKNY